jgi:3-oxoacyl-[acyl-carrier-protein] synthase-3
VAHALNLVGVPAFDVNGACAGGVIGLLVALNFLAAGMARRVLLVASDTTTRHLAYDDAHTRILFGDGAAALLLTLSQNGGSRLRAWVAGSDGSGAELFHVPRNGAEALVNPGHSTVRMQGPTLYRFAAQRGSEMLLDTCAAAGVSPQDVDLVVVHQANLRIIEALQHRTCIAADRWVVNLQNIGNTGGASVLLALAQVLRARSLHRGSRVLIGAFGAGLTWAAMLIEW